VADPAGALLPCIRCGDCIPACPAGLQPQALWFALRADDDALAIARGLDACRGCGDCDAACPSRLPLAATLVARRDALRERASRLVQASAARQRYEARELRLAVEAQARLVREAQLLDQATSEDAVEAAIARALARRQGPGPA
jgi:Na+-translocating ferredoxin:NAD+ oxidoreductase subunit C